MPFTPKDALDNLDAVIAAINVRITELEKEPADNRFAQGRLAGLRESLSLVLTAITPRSTRQFKAGDGSATQEQRSDYYNGKS